MFNIGFFGRLAAGYGRVLTRMWRYVVSCNWFVKLFALPVFLFYAPFLIFAAIAFAMLIPLDVLAAAIDAVRSSLLRFCARMSYESSDNFFGFLLLPAVLLVLAPIVLLIVIIPKVSSLADEL